MNSQKKNCVKCVLHTNIPGITINDDGICSVCERFSTFKNHEPKVKKYLIEEMERLFVKIKEKQRTYHAAVLFSGGKDSTMLLKMAKEKYNLRVLAIAVMHPLVNDKAKKNMEEVAQKLNVDLVKLYINETIYRKAIQNAVVNGTKYDLGEFFGCDICSFFHMWLPIRYAMKMDIPVILEGSDLSQTAEMSYGQAERVREDAKKGIKPFGKVHDLISDILDDEFKGSIYDYSADEVISGAYPSIISPFSFIQYDYRENFKVIDDLGLNSDNFRSIYTNCSATPFFSFFALKKFDCVSYIKHYATEVRRDYPNLGQYISDDEDNKEKGKGIQFNKETVETLMNEYRDILFHIVENKLDNDNITEDEKARMKKMAPYYMKIFGEGVCDIFLTDALTIPHYADYFGIDLEKIIPSREF
jgi:predicted PP-loop superfamily ATPase